MSGPFVEWCECCGSPDDVRIFVDDTGRAQTLCGECAELADAESVR